MKCPFCDSEATKVVDKRDNRDDSSTRRRRQCLRCSKRFTTYERIEKADLSIQKKDGSLEKFDTEKIRKGIKKAVDHEKITEDDIEGFLDEVEKYVLNKEDIVTSREIGLMILDWLKSKDSLAYIRFASVYKGFKGVEEIVDEITELQKKELK
jgi:transcriptional repressor NrdR